MSNWAFDMALPGTQTRTLSVLELRLSESEQKRRYSPYKQYACEVRLRAGVIIGRTTAASTLVRLDVKAKTDFLARLEAERQAEKWFANELDALLTQ
jgi:seryl-tRNA(Sec) selenium transferase